MTPDFRVTLPVFEGPFDVLLQLIEEGKVDLYQVSLTDLTAGYLAYLAELPVLDIVRAGDFLIMAAYLLELKSRLLLPQEEPPVEEEEDLRATLLNRLVEYRVFKGLAQNLKERKEIFEKVYSRFTFEKKETEEPRDIYLADVNLADLVQAFQKVWTEVERRGEVREIEEEKFTVADKIEEIVRRLEAEPEGISFESLFTVNLRLEVIVTFLAILELLRRRLIRATQEKNYGSILIIKSAVGG